MLRIILIGIGIGFMALCSSIARAQGITPQNLERLQIMEDSMLITVDSMFNAFIPETHVEYSERLVRQLVKTLKVPNSYLYPFTKLGEKLNIITPEDKAFRMFNWECDFSTMYRRYYGAIQLPSEQLKLYGLIDYSDKIGKYAEDTILTKGKWFGALYYKIIPTEYNGNTLYTLLGVNEGSPVSNKRVVEAMSVSEEGITFGAPVFGIGSKIHPRQPTVRYVMEYKKDVKVTLRWDADKGLIAFDELVSGINDPARKYTYRPSGQYDGLRWNDGMWNYQRNLMPIQVLQDGQAPIDEK
jgi:hypothetical protein